MNSVRCSYGCTTDETGIFPAFEQFQLFSSGDSNYLLLSPGGLILNTELGTTFRSRALPCSHWDVDQCLSPQVSEPQNEPS